MTLIAASAVTKRFGADTAVDGVSLEVGSGEVVGLLGANGAGKTTLIRLVLGLLSADSGSVSVLGQAPSRPTRARLGYVPQGLALWSELTARHHIELFRAVYGAEATLDDDLAAASDEPVAALPLGLRRRLAFALAVAHDPAIVILDEPTAGVDPLGRARLWDRIRAVADGGAGVLVSTHYMDEAAQCDRSVFLADGRVVAAGTVDELTRGRRALLVRPDSWQRAWEALDAAEVPVVPTGRRLRVPGTGKRRVRDILAAADVSADVDEVAATLEEVFLAAAATR